MSETSDKLTDVIMRNCCKPGVDREALRSTLAEMVDHAKLEAGNAIARALFGAGHSEAAELVMWFVNEGIVEMQTGLANREQVKR